MRAVRTSLCSYDQPTVTESAISSEQYIAFFNSEIYIVITKEK